MNADVNRKQIVYSVVGCLLTENTADMAQTKTSDSFAWTDNEEEVLLKVTREYKAVKAVETRSAKLLKSKCDDMLERYRQCALSIARGSYSNGKGVTKQKGQNLKGLLT